MRAILLDSLRAILTECENAGDVPIEILIQDKVDTGLEGVTGFSRMEVAERLRTLKWVVNDPANPINSILSDEGREILTKLQEWDDDELKEIENKFLGHGHWGTG